MAESGVLSCFIIFIILNIVNCQGQFQCPEGNGKSYYADQEQCDLYYICHDGVAEEKLCKDGLVFRDDNHKKELCDLPANVPCGERTLLRK